MAYGNEVMFGYRYHEFKELHSLMEVHFDEFDLEEDDDAYHDLCDLLEGLFQRANEKIEELFPTILEEAGFKYLGKSTRSYYVAETPLGKREFSPIRLEFQFDPYELGERLQDSVIGFALSGRYVPTFLDWKDPSGTLWNITFDQEFLSLVDCAKKHLLKEFPMFENAHIIVRENHY